MTRESTDTDTAEQVIDSFRILAGDKVNPVPISYLQSLHIWVWIGNNDVVFSSLALHHGGRAQAWVASRPGRILRGAHATIPRPWSTRRRSWLHGILHRIIRRDRPLRYITIIINKSRLHRLVFLKKLFKTPRPSDRLVSMVFGKPPDCHWAVA